MAHYGQGGPTARQFWEEMRILNIWFWHRCHTSYPSSDHQKKHVFQKKIRIQNIFWTCYVFLLEDNVWHFCTLSNAQEGVHVVHCETQKGWTVNTLSTQMSKQVSGFKQFPTGTTSPTEIVLFSILITCHFLEHFSTRLSFAIGGVVCDRPVAIWQVRPHNFGVALHYIANKPASQQYTARSS